MKPRRKSNMSDTKGVGRDRPHQQSWDNGDLLETDAFLATELLGRGGLVERSRYFKWRAATI